MRYYHRNIYHIPPEIMDNGGKINCRLSQRIWYDLIKVRFSYVCNMPELHVLKIPYSGNYMTGERSIVEFFTHAK